MRSYEFGDFQLDTRHRRLARSDGTPVVLTPRLFDALVYLVEHAGELLDKETLLKALWPGLVVEENSLSQTISALRRALGDGAQDSAYIQTAPRRGFRFIAAVRVRDEDASSPETVEPIAPSGPVDAAPPLAAVVEPSRDRRRLLVAAGVGLATAGGATWWWRSRQRPAGPTGSVSLAVLPFKPLVSEARDPMLEFGMADSLVARLSSLPGVAVRSIGSVRQFAGPVQDPLKAARELQVQWIVDGSVQRWGDQVRVTARLLDTASGEAAWSGSFDENFTGMFDLQDAISRRVADVLAPKLRSADRRRLAGAGGTRNIDAYQLYLLARQQAQGIRTAGLVRSIDLFSKAIALDPAYALAHAGTAESYRRMIFGSDGEPRVIFREAEKHAARCIAIDPDLADGFASTGWNLYWHAWDWPRAEAAFRRAIALNANDVNAHFGLGQLLDTVGRHDEEVVEMALAREVDPLSPITLTLESNSLFWSGRRDEAWQHLRRVLEIEPEFWVAHLSAGSWHRVEGKNDLAIESMERAERFADGSSQPTAAFGYLLARLGFRERARQLADRLLDESHSRYVPPTSYAIIYTGLGDKEAALQALEQAVAVRDVRMTLMYEDKRWASLADEPRFTAIMRGMRFAG